MHIIYFSSVSENTKRFVEKLGLSATRIPLTRVEEPVLADGPFLLVVPTYGGGSRKGADVPPQVVRFLNNESNRKHLMGVVASGNTNFGSDFCRAGHVVSQKLGVPLLHQFELLGTSEDVHIVQKLTEMNTYVPTE